MWRLKQREIIDGQNMKAGEVKEVKWHSNNNKQQEEGANTRADYTELRPRTQFHNLEETRLNLRIDESQLADNRSVTTMRSYLRL